MKEIKVKPLGDNILIQPEGSGKKTDSGIFLPNLLQRKTAARKK